MSDNNKPIAKTTKSATGYGEYDAETVERIHQENIRKSKLASEQSKGLESSVVVKKYTWKGAPRHVGEHEISPYQGNGDRRQMQKAQSRKRRQIRRREASIWDDLAPKEVHGILNFMLTAIVVLSLTVVFLMAGRH
jgi:hypothetical protein